MKEERRQILEMLSEGKINSEEAERLIAALEKSNGSTSTSSKPSTAAKYLRILVETDEKNEGKSPTKVNVRVPLQLLRAGIRLASLVPANAKTQVNEALRENGIDVDVSKLSPENIEELIQNLNELTVDVDDDENKVRIFCE
ncbi:MAG: SHOCT-like domain-containing protein [Pseudobdellovibrionaceae bacterium]